MMRIVLLASVPLLVAASAFSVAAHGSIQQRTVEGPTPVLQAPLSSAVRSGTIDTRRSRLIAAQIRRLESRYREYSSDGLTPSELEALRAEIDRIMAHPDPQVRREVRAVLVESDVFKGMPLDDRR